MATKTIDERLATLEAEVARLKASGVNGSPAAAPWWEQRFGAFKDDPHYDEAMRLGAEYRRSQPTFLDGDAPS